MDVVESCGINKGDRGLVLWTLARASVDDRHSGLSVLPMSVLCKV